MMNRKLPLILFVLFFVTLVAGNKEAFSADSFRIMVDKGHPAHSKLVESDFKQLKDAGFSHVAIRWDTDLNGKEIDIKNYIALANAENLGVVKWGYGLVRADDGMTHFLNRLGKETTYSSPLDERAWRVLEKRVVEFAELSAEYPNFQGMVLDFEIYDKDKKGQSGFSESFDDESLSRFITSLGREVPNPLPAPEERKQWLEKREWFQMFVAWQMAEIKKKAHSLRQKVDAINPHFQFGIYGWGVLVSPFREALATAKAPVLILNASTYGRSTYSNAFQGGYDGELPDREALKWTLKTVREGAARTHSEYENTLYLGGHYPQSPGPEDGTQYKFTAKQAFLSATAADGYWIWTDWNPPKAFGKGSAARRKWWDAMMEYFKEANTALEKGDADWAMKQPEVVTKKN